MDMTAPPAGGGVTAVRGMSRRRSTVHVAGIAAARREDDLLEAGHGADSVAGEREHEQADSLTTGGGGSVDTERRLTVGSRRHQFESRCRAENEGAEAGHAVSA